MISAWNMAHSLNLFLIIFSVYKQVAIISPSLNLVIPFLVANLLAILQEVKLICYSVRSEMYLLF